MEIIAFIIFFQIVIESLPVSSSTHLILIYKINELLGGASSELSSNLDLFLHGPAALIILMFFYKEWKDKVSWLLSTSLMPKAQQQHSKLLHTIAFKLVSYVFIADLITFVFYYFKKNIFNFQSPYIVAIGLAFTCFALLSLLLYKDKNYESLTLYKVIFLGIVQGFSFFPGISRFGITYVAGRFLKLSPKRSFQVSWLLFFPLCVAGFLKGSLKLLKTSALKLILVKYWLIFIVAIIISLYVLKFAYKLALSNKFWRFGIYLPVPIISFLLIISYH